MNGFQKKTQKTTKKEIELALKIKTKYESEKKSFTTLKEFKEKNYGKKGTKERDELEWGFENFKNGALIHDARIEMA